jgi:hypothetical protein
MLRRTTFLPDVSTGYERLTMPHAVAPAHDRP